MKIRNVLLGLAVIALAGGLVLYLGTMDRKTQWSSWSWSTRGPVPGQAFVYGGETLSPNDPLTRVVVVGTSGVANLMLLQGSVESFNRWICPLLSSSYAFHTANGCSTNLGFVGGSGYLNVTILESYLQAHPGEILYTRTIVDENVTVDYLVSRPTNLTIVMAHMGSEMATSYWRSTTTNQTLSYPMLGYVEHAGSSFWSLPNLSLDLVGIGVAGIVATSVTYRRRSSMETRPISQEALVACRACGRENFSWAEQCKHCGLELNNKTSRIAPSAPAT